MKKRLHAWIMKRWAVVLTFKYRGSVMVVNGAWMWIVHDIHWSRPAGFCATGYNAHGAFVKDSVYFRNNRVYAKNIGGN